VQYSKPPGMQQFKYHYRKKISSPAIKDKLTEERKFHKLQTNRCLVLKIKLNKIITAVQNLLKSERNHRIQRYLSELNQLLKPTIPCEKPPRD